MIKIKLKHLSVLFSIIGILVLYAISLLAQPNVITLEEIPNFENKKVTVEGTVKEYHTTQYGSQMITIQDENASAIVFSETEINLEYGDIIKATGKVQKYDNDWEIIVDNNRFIEIIQHWENKTTPLWELAEKPEKYAETNIKTQGYTDSVFDEYFYLTDEEIKQTIIVFYDKYTHGNIDTGEQIQITGFFKYDKENFRYIITLTNEEHKITKTTGEQ